MGNCPSWNALNRGRDDALKENSGKLLIVNQLNGDGATVVTSIPENSTPIGSTTMDNGSGRTVANSSVYNSDAPNVEGVRRQDFTKNEVRSIRTDEVVETFHRQVISSSFSVGIAGAIGTRKGLQTLEERINDFAHGQKYDQDEISRTIKAVKLLLPKMEELVSTSSKYSESYLCLYFLVYATMILNSAFGDGSSEVLTDQLISTLKTDRKDWMIKIRALEGPIQRKLALSIGKVDNKFGTPGSSSTLILETTKMELLIMSIPVEDTGSRAISILFKTIGAFVLLPLSAVSSLTMLKEGAIDAANMTLFYGQRAHAKAVSEIFIELDKLVLQASYKASTGELSEVYITNVRTKILELEKVYLKGKTEDEKGNQGLKSQRWEIYAAFATMLTDLILRLSPVTYLRNKFLKQVCHLSTLSI